MERLLSDSGDSDMDHFLDLVNAARIKEIHRFFEEACTAAHKTKMALTIPDACTVF